ncbi:MAG: TonB-dependent receptor [Acidobacteria bacterium]|nr:TonB-dependent receptor [Acidobacteriota bacterium]
MRLRASLGILLLGWANTGPAQSLFGTILGTVTDSTGGAVAGARIRIRNTATNAVREIRSSTAGDYQAPSLAVGPYEITAEAAGFKRALAPAIVLTLDQRARVDFQLELGSVDQVVEVTSATPLIETDTASQGTVVDNRRIVQLPLNGRNFQTLAILGPGVIAPVAGSGGRFSVAGTRGLSNSFMLDGATNTNSNANGTFIDPSVDLIEEFKIQRNTFNAEYGNGAAQINVVTKSGTNSLRLVLFEFLRNEKIQARNFFDGARKPALRRNQFGGTVSGPVYLPKLYDGRNRSFWLFNYEGVRQRAPNTLLSSLPTQAELDGDLSSLAGGVTDPAAAGQPFPGARIPASRVDPTTRAYRPFVPVVSAPRGSLGPGINLLTPVSTANDWDQHTLKFDQQLNRAGQFFARYTTNESQNITAAIHPLYRNSPRGRQYNIVAGHNFLFRPNLINEFRGAFSRHKLLQGPPEPHPQNFADVLGLRNLLSRSDPAFNSLPAVNLTGFTGLGGPALITQRVNTWSWLDNLTWIRSSHTVKAGFDIRHRMLDIRNIGSTQGSFGFAGNFTRSAIGDYLLGIPRTAGAAAPPGPDGVNLSPLWQWFVQDDWKVTGDLTLSFGLRYEYAAPFANDRDRRSLFDPTFPGGRLIYPGRADYFVPGRGFIPTERPLAPRGLVPQDKNNLAPRFGFAWRPFGNTRNSVRGSYGIFYEASNNNNEVLFGSFNFPHVLNHSLTNDLTRPSFVWSNLFPDQVTVGSVGFSSLDTNLPTGYLQQWSLNLQRELRPNLAVELGYMGTKGTKLDWRTTANQAALDANPARPTSIVSRLPFPAFAPGAGLITRNGFSNYHAFISRLERSFSRGLHFLASYTFSKGIDNSSFGLLSKICG